MYITSVKLIAYSIILSATICVAQAQSLRSEINSANGKIANAMLKKDFTSLTKMMKAAVTPDFKYYETGEKGAPQSVDTMISNMKTGISAMSKVTVSTAKLLTLKEKGATATSTTEYKMGGIIMGPDKKTHKMMSVGVSDDSYVKVKGKWLLSKMVFKTNSMTMDGKPMDMSKMHG